MTVRRDYCSKFVLNGRAARQRTGSGRVRYPACSVVSVADAAEIVEVAPIHSTGGSNFSIISLDEHLKQQGQDETHRHAPREARGDVGRWG